MNRALDVARYIINYSNKKKYGITNLKLQKLLYFVQAYFLLCNENVCFREDIEAWDFGPVVPDVYREFKRFGSGEIPPVKIYLETGANASSICLRKFDESVIDPDDQNLISEVVDEFSDYSATALVTLTHNQAPWQDAYHSGENGKIDPESIRRYFADE